MTPQEYQMLLLQQQQQIQQNAPPVQQNGGNAATNPAGRTIAEWAGDPAKAASQNTAQIASSLATGTGLRSSDGKGFINPVDVLRQQGASGTPIGMLYNNAAGSARENAILGAGAGDEAAYRSGNQGLASGFTGNNAFRATNQALNGLQAAGNNDLASASKAANAAGQVAGGMGSDIAGLRQAAAGNVPSAAQIQQRQGISDAINSQAAMAAAARGGNLASAMRGAQAAGSNMQAQGVANNAALRANEMATARGQLTQATGTQGQLFNQSGAINNSVGQSEITRANAGVVGAGNVGQAVLGSQMTGNNGFANGAQLEQGRVGAAVGQDRQDVNDLNNYLLQLNNQGLGFGAQNYGTDVNAGVQTRGQNLQLLGSAASGLGSSLAGFATR